jgi:hypothetical protein
MLSGFGMSQVHRFQALSALELEDALEGARRDRLEATQEESLASSLCQQAQQELAAARTRPGQLGPRLLNQNVRILKERLLAARIRLQSATAREVALLSFRTVQLEGGIEGRKPTSAEADVLERYIEADGVVNHWFWKFERSDDERVWRQVARGSLYASLAHDFLEWSEVAAPKQGWRVDREEFLARYREAVLNPPYRLRTTQGDQLFHDLVQVVLQGVPPDATVYSWSIEHPYFNAGKEWWDTVFYTVQSDAGGVGLIASATD